MRTITLALTQTLLACLLTWAGVAGTVLEAAQPGTQAGTPARLLVVTVTTGFRHGSIATAEPVLEELGRTSGLFHPDFLRMPPDRPPAPKAPKRADGTSDADWQKQEAEFKEAQAKHRVAETAWQAGVKEQFAKAFAADSLAAFDGVIFANTTGELPIPDMDAFLAWLKTGKAFIGMHAATDTLKASLPYVEMIGGAFAGHPWGGGGEHAFVVHDPQHPIVSMLPPAFRWKDEIYQYDLRYKPENLRVLVSIDMAGSTPKEPWHVPVSWVRDYGSGRVFYTNFGHNDTTWKDPKFQQHIQQGIAWALKRYDAAATPNPDVQAAEYVRSVIAAAAAATGGDADKLRARADAKIAANPAWATGLRPALLELRGQKPTDRTAGYAKLVADIETP